MKIGRPGEGLPKPVDATPSKASTRKTEGAKSASADPAGADFDRVAEQRERALSSKAADLLKRAQSSPAGGSAHDTPELMIGEAFEKAIGRNPLASPRAPIGKGAAEQARQTPGFGEAVSAGRAVAADPENDSLVETFTNKVEAMVTSGKGSDVLGALFHLFKDSMADMNEDKRQLLEQLAEKNEQAQALGDYLHDLMEAGAEGADQPKPLKPEKGRSPGESTPPSPDPTPPSPLGDDAGTAATPLTPRGTEISKEDLPREIARVKKEQTEARADSETTSLRLQTVLDRTAKVQNVLVRVLRSINDTQGDLVQRIR